MSPQGRKGHPSGAGDLFPISFMSRTTGPWECSYGHFPSFEGNLWKQIPHQMVSNSSFNLCLLHWSPWLSSQHLFVSLSRWNSPMELGETSCCWKKVFFFCLHLLKHLASCLDWHLLVPENTLLSFWVCMVQWHCRHCSRASSFPELTGEATISSPQHKSDVFWRKGWGGLRTQTSAPPTASKLLWKMQGCAMTPCEAPYPCLGMDYCKPEGCPHLLNHSHRQLVGWIYLEHKQGKSQWCYPRKGGCSCVHPCPHKSSHPHSLEREPVLSKVKSLGGSVYLSWFGLEV